jgi:hypothetical protein
MKSRFDLFRRLPGITMSCALLYQIGVAPLMMAEDSPFGGESKEWLVWHAGESEIVDPGALQESYNVYLVSPPLLATPAQARLKLLHQCESQLGPGVAPPSDLGKAYASLQQLALDPLDHGRCRTLLRAVVNASAKLAGEKNPPASEAALLRQKEILSWNLRIEQKQQQQRIEDLGPLTHKRPTPQSTPISKAAQQLAALDHEIAEINLGSEVSDLQVRLELQELALRFLRQGDYAEAILAIRFYRGLFGDWDPPLRLGRDAMMEIAPEDGKPALGTIEFLSAQALQAIRENLSRCTILLEGNHTLEGSGKLLAAFARGSRTLEVLSFSENSKQKIQHLAQLQKGLEKSLADKEYTEALSLLIEISAASADFDATKYHAEIQAAKSLSSAHLLSARTAGREGRTGDFMKELMLAEESWPKNPDIAVLVKEFAGSVEIKNSSVEEFDRLYMAQQIDEITKQRLRFEELLADLPVRHAQLMEALKEYSTIRDGTERAHQLRDLGNKVSSWELADSLSSKYPERKELVALCENMLPGVEDLVAGLKRARALEGKEPASSLSLYLQLQERFPQSSRAKEGVGRLSSSLLAR